MYNYKILWLIEIWFLDSLNIETLEIQNCFLNIYILLKIKIWFWFLEFFEFEFIRFFKVDWRPSLKSYWDNYMYLNRAKFKFHDIPQRVLRIRNVHDPACKVNRENISDLTNNKQRNSIHREACYIQMNSYPVHKSRDARRFVWRLRAWCVLLKTFIENSCILWER